MLVPNTARRSVIFIGNTDSNGEFKPRASGFLVRAGGDLPGSVLFPYLVTAAHVVTGMISTNMVIQCRLNMKDGSTGIFPIPPNNWWFHPDNRVRQTDVAVVPLFLQQDLVDHDYIPLINRPIHIDRIPRLGEEVFIMGLFKSHYGKKRNVPIVRIGNIAALPEEPISTKMGFIDAYLLEMRSIAGLSGSPVFKNAEGKMPFPKAKGAMASALDNILEERRSREEIDWYDWHFVGLVHGHFDVKDFTEDATIEDAGIRSNEINTGIGIVIPASKVLETLFQTELVNEQYKMARTKNGALT